jgi:arsenite methyltransferase
MVVITQDHRDVILDAVQSMYTAVARNPEQTFHFPTGRAACLLVGYPAAELDAVPASAVESFAGVGYPFAADAVKPGDIVLDIGSGSGTDALIAAHRAGAAGLVYGLDLTEAMREKLRRNAAAIGANVQVLEGNAEDIPLESASVDVVTSNGVINLVPDKAKAMSEIARVLRPGGRVQIADIVLAVDPSDSCRSQPELWAECIVGATREEEYLTQIREAGLEDVEVLSRHEYFEHSPDAGTRDVARSFGAVAFVLRARRP